MTYITSNPLKPLAEQLDVDPWTVTNSGSKIYYTKFSKADIIFEDIAWHLAHTNRWVGALGDYYSTAQHSVLLAQHALTCEERALPISSHSRRVLARALLLHDAEEYLTCDFPAPLKVFFPLLTNYADYVRQIIFDKYDVPYEFYNLCKAWDRRILFDEAEWGLVGGRKAIEEPGNIVHTLGVRIHSLLPLDAYKRFKEIFLRLA